MPSSTPDALLFITSSCPHCPVVLQGLSELVKQAVIGKLTVVNVAAHPEMAEEYGVRAAPWLRLGPFTLTGAHTAAELKQWAEWCSSDAGMVNYIEQLLKDGSIKSAGEFIAEDTQRLKHLLSLMADPGKNLNVRAGASALLESYHDAAPLQQLLPLLAALSQHADHRVRADACNLLGHSGSPAARPYLETCVRDASAEVREIAQESLQLLAARGN